MAMRRRGTSPTWPWSGPEPDARDRRSFADAAPRPFWLDSPHAPAPRPPLAGHARADLVVVGGGLGGLWAALQAKQIDPALDVALVEAQSIAGGATGRSGGFLSYSLTHGASNGMSRFPEEMPLLERLGRQNFDRTLVTLGQFEVDCDLEQTGDLAVALEPHEAGWLAEDASVLEQLGHDVVLLDADAARAELDSPLYRAALWQRTGAAILDPARLAWGLLRAAESLGVRVHEHTPATRVQETGDAVVVGTRGGSIRARQALLATGALRSPLAAVRRRVVPVWDYVLVTEPLDASRMGAIGWRRRQGVSDVANRFHYYRLTADNRILWGGYDAVYHFANGTEKAHAQREATFARLAQHFFCTFPQLEGVRFTHRWGGAIDTCSRFFAFYGTSRGGRIAYEAGHTGLGIGASRFAARVALDLLAGRETEATRSRLVGTRPLPFPPEPLRWAVIQATRAALARADRRQGRRGPWLRLLDRAGVGYDS
jgi:glycine/D-amino acid oxidase-like deaminating enzyme